MSEKMTGNLKESYENPSIERRRNSGGNPTPGAREVDLGRPWHRNFNCLSQRGALVAQHVKPVISHRIPAGVKP